MIDKIFSQMKTFKFNRFNCTVNCTARCTASNSPFLKSCASKELIVSKRKPKKYPGGLLHRPWSYDYSISRTCCESKRQTMQCPCVHMAFDESCTTSPDFRNRPIDRRQGKVRTLTWSGSSKAELWRSYNLGESILGQQLKKLDKKHSLILAGARVHLRTLWGSYCLVKIGSQILEL